MSLTGLPLPGVPCRCGGAARRARAPERDAHREAGGSRACARSSRAGRRLGRSNAARVDADVRPPARAAAIARIEAARLAPAGGRPPPPGPAAHRAPSAPRGNARRGRASFAPERRTPAQTRRGTCAPTRVVEAEVVQEPVDSKEREPPARVEPFIAPERAHDSKHRLAVVPEELLRELDPLIAAVAPELAFVRVELEPPHHTVSEKRLCLLAQQR